MTTRLLMLTSSLFLAFIGITLSFFLQETASFFTKNAEPFTALLLQLTGGLYLGFALLNYMAKGVLLGGIYNRPIAMANFTHFLVTGLALLKGSAALQNPTVYWAISLLYLLFALSFGLVTFTHPATVKAVSEK